MDGIESQWALRELQNELERTEKTIDRLVVLHKETSDALDFNAKYLESLRTAIALREASHAEIVRQKPVTFAGIS